MIKLTLLHTNDLHGRVHQLARIASVVRKIRAELEAAGGFCFYLDAGDSEDTTLLESTLTRGSAMNAILRGAGCDQVALGNAIPIRYGPQEIQNLALHFGKPMLCANLLDGNDQPFAGLTPFAIQSIGDFRFAIIGLTAPMNVYADFFKANAIQPEEIMPELIEQVRKAGAKTIVVLSHLGSKGDIKLAEKVEGIDVIIGGHDHKQIAPPLMVNGALIVQAGEYGQRLGRLDLLIDPRTGSVIQSNEELIPIDEGLQQDDLVLTVVASEKERALQMMSLEIGELKEPLVFSEQVECSTGNLLADAMLEHVEGSQVALIINGHWQHGLDAGVVTQGGLYSAERSTGNPARVELTIAQIKQFLKAALKPENIASKPHPLRGISVGMPHIAGMNVVFDRDKPEKIEIWIDGSPAEDDTRLIVATSDLELSDILGYLIIPNNDVAYEVPTILPEVLEGYIRKHSPIGRINVDRIKKSLL
jgi:5'-nucleotidase